MLFDERLEEILGSIGYGGSEEDIVREEHTAYRWSESTTQNGCFDRILERMYDKDYTISEKRDREIRMVICELVLNSSAHGCKERDDLSVGYTVYFGNQGICAHITDEGGGFDHQNVLEKLRQHPDKRTDEELLKMEVDECVKGGFGIASLMRFGDDFQYNEKGNEVIVKFNLQLT